MMNKTGKNVALGLLLCLLLPFGLSAQRTTSMRINEVMVDNETNFMDDYGCRSGWIELFNSSAGMVNVGGCFLTDDLSNPKKYFIPKGDVLTQIQPRQHVLFWTDGTASKGTFHTNFKLIPGQPNFVALFDADGVTLIDSVTVPASLPADKTFGRSSDAVTKGDYLVQSKIWRIMPNVTPSTNNVTLDTNDKVDRFRDNDPDGFAMTITAMSVVFSALLMLFLCFKGVGKLAIRLGKRRAKESGSTEESSDIPGEVLAAISTALYELDQDVHDIEHTVLTIRKAKSNYSPWSSKIYSLRENPRK